MSDGFPDLMPLMSSSAADAPDRVAPDDEPAAPSGEAGDGPAAHPERSGDGAVSSRSPLRRLGRRRLVTSVTAVAVAAAVVAGVIVAFAGHSAPAPARPATAGGTAAAGAAARPAVLADEAAATVAVVTTNGSITGGPVLGKDGQLWLVEAGQATGRPMLTVVNPATFAVSTQPLPSSLDGVSLHYTGAEAFDNVGQLWLGATAAPAGQQPAGVLVRYLPGTGAIAWYSLSGTCSGDPAEPPAQLFTASDGGVWVECAASADPAATAIVRLQRNGAFIQPTIADYLSPALRGTTRWKALAYLSQAKIGPLVPAADGTMVGATAGGYVQITAAGDETFTYADQYAFGLVTATWTTVGAVKLAGNGLTPSVGGVGECRPSRAPASQTRECAVSVDAGGGQSVLGAAPDYDGKASGSAMHPAGMDQSGDIWFLVDGTAGGKAPAGQYFFEVNPGGGTRIIPFSVPGDASPIPAVQAPVIAVNGAVWTADPHLGPGTLVAVMAKN